MSASKSISKQSHQIMNPSRPLLALATSLAALSSPLPAQTLKVFLLAGQSNMQGQAYTFDSAQTASWNIPTMEFLLSGTPAATDYLANMPFGFKSSLAASWLNPRTDAWCVHYDSSNGTTKGSIPARLITSACWQPTPMAKAGRKAPVSPRHSPHPS